MLSYSGTKIHFFSCKMDYQSITIYKADDICLELQERGLIVGGLHSSNDALTPRRICLRMALRMQFGANSQ